MATVSRERSAVVRTVVPSVTVLFAELGSASVPVTLAVLVRTPAAVGLTLIVTVALAPLARLPTAQVNVVVPLHEPWLAEADTKLTPAGSESVSVTPVAADGPLLRTTTAYVSTLPTASGSGVSDWL